MLLYRTSSYKWTLIGTAVVGMFSYYVVSKLGKKIPNKIADQAVIQAFSEPNQSTLPMIRRAVLERTKLRAEVIKTIFSCCDTQKRNQLTACYVERFEKAYGATQVSRGVIFCEIFQALWENATDEDRKFLLKWNVALSVSSFITSYKIRTTLPMLSEQEKIELWTLVQTEYMAEGLLRFAGTEQEVRDIFAPGALKLLAKKLIEDQQNQKSWSKILLQLNLFIKFFNEKYFIEPKTLMKKLDLSDKCIDMTSPLGSHLLTQMSTWTLNNAELYLLNYI